MSLCLSSLIFILLTYSIGVTWSQEDNIRGHMQPLGMHRDPEGHVDIYELDQIPSPKEFWTKYVKGKRPALFRGAAKISPAFTKWTDEYLLNNYGDLQVKLESKLEKKVTPIGNIGLGRDSISYFLQTYLERDVYIVSQLPSPMTKDVYVPPYMTCGSFKQRIMEANLWISNGGTSSLLHKDALNTLNCLINGTKNWIMISSDYIDKVPMAKEPDSEVGGFSVLNVNKVNLKRYPKFREVPWHYANVTSGDCLYIPTGYLHQVRSTGPKNMAYSLLADYELISFDKFDNSDCENPKYKLLSESNIVFEYPGYGTMSMGSPSPHITRDEVIDLFSRKKRTKSSKFIKFLLNNGIIDDDDELRKYSQLNAYKKYFNFGNKEYVTLQDIQDMPFSNWTALATEIDPDVANREDFEYFQLDVKQIKLEMESRVFKRSIDKKTGDLDVNRFLQEYRAVGGSAPFGKKNIVILDTNKDGQVQKDELRKNKNKVLRLYDTLKPSERAKVDDYSFMEGRGDSNNEREKEEDDEENDRDDDRREQDDADADEDDDGEREDEESNEEEASKFRYRDEL